MFKRSHLFILVALFAITFGAPNVPNESDKQDAASDADSDSRIIGGKKSQQGAHPYMCSLQNYYGGATSMKFCGAAIIGRNHLLTAAHCIFDARDPMSISLMRALCGTLHVDRIDAPGAQFLKIRDIIQHPAYDNVSNHNDIAIIVTEDIKFTHDSYPISLPPPTHRPTESGPGTIMGWGDTVAAFGAQESASDLMEGQGNPLNYTYCRSKWGWNLIDNQFCVTHSTDNVCRGDSGGPFVQVSPEINRPVIAGVVSYGFPECAVMPTVFTDVAKHLEFIKSHVH